MDGRSTLIVWVDDTTFLVAANYKQDESTPTEVEEGEVVVDEEFTPWLSSRKKWKGISEALKSRFHKDESIISLHQHLPSLEKSLPRSSRPVCCLVSGVSLFGSKKETEEIDEPRRAPHESADVDYIISYLRYVYNQQARNVK
jgi:hypothetical protein